MLFDRRLFLKSLGIIGSSTLVSCDVMAPREKLAAYLTPPAEMIPGRAAYYATVCRACPAGCGILVKTREGRPIKLEGNPAHPVNRGRLCARGQAFVQDLYNPNRIRKPMVIEGGEPKETPWRAAANTVAASLKTARSVGFLTGLESVTFDMLVRDFCAGYDSFAHVVTEPAALVSMAEASRLVFGVREVPRIDLSKADHIVSLGADFLDTWYSPVELTRQWSEAHAATATAGRTLQMDYAGPLRNLTATAADRWHSLRGSETGALALAILRGIFDKKQNTIHIQIRGEIAAAIQRLEGLSGKTELPKTLVEGLVGRLIRARSGLVLFGGSGVTDERAVFVHAAALLTNHLLGAVGKSLSYHRSNALSRVSPEREAVKLLESAGRSGPEVIFIAGANPAYTLPGGSSVQKLLKKAKLVVSLAHTHDETTALADVVLPVHHPLESWGDYDVTGDIAGLMQPVRAPLFDTQHMGDLLILLREMSGQKLPHRDYKGYLTARWATRLDRAIPAPTAQIPDGGPGDPDAGVPAPPPEPSMDDSEWEEMLVRGGFFKPVRPQGAPGLDAAALMKLPAVKPVESAPIELIIPFSTMRYDGRGAGLDWLRETPEPLLQTAWEMPAEVAPDVARRAGIKMGIKTGDLLRIKSGAGEVTVRAHVSKDVAPGTVALAPGGGKRYARHQKDTGNPFALLADTFAPVSGELSLTARGVTVRRQSTGELISVMGSADSEGRLLALDVGLTDFRKGRIPKITRHGQVSPGDKHYEDAEPVPMPHQEKGKTRPKDNIYSLQEHAKHRWGLVVDLDKCTGCSACVVSCYAENNIPVVGPKEVSRGRELSWIRIEKHVFKLGDQEAVRFLPVMCQQCDNAPCETVCPVFASSHTTDGLNAQIYNRCVGTRYCANNCPYKVRRFNFFDYEREALGAEQLNPDVTVRSRGVMEKCTFCIQRIREAQNRTKLTKKPLKDGDIVPACVQTCPAGALSFGDFTKAEWQMTQLARDPRGYRLLDYITNTRPGVVYLRKVTTKEKG